MSSGLKCSDFKGECEEPRTSQQEVLRCKVTSRLVTTFLLRDFADRDLTAYLIHSHPDGFLLMHNQLTRRGDKGDLKVQSHLEHDKGIRLFDVSLRWPHSSQQVRV